jgi:hypothetical protein
MDTDPATLSARELGNRLTSIIRDYAAYPNTPALYDLAILIVELRSRYHLEDGTRDWGGRSTAYRTVIADAYTRAGVTAENRARIQGASRYHIGNELRRRVPDHELAAAGLMATSPRSRASADRSATHTLRNTTLNGDHPLTLAQSAARLLDRIDTDDVILEDYVDFQRVLTAIAGRAKHLAATV